MATTWEVGHRLQTLKSGHILLRSNRSAAVPNTPCKKPHPSAAPYSEVGRCCTPTDVRRENPIFPTKGLGVQAHRAGPAGPGSPPGQQTPRVQQVRAACVVVGGVRYSKVRVPKAPTPIHIGKDYTSPLVVGGGVATVPSWKGYYAHHRGAGSVGPAGPGANAMTASSRGWRGI